MLKMAYSTVRSMKNVAVLTDGRPGYLTAQESQPPGICHPKLKKKNANALGSAGRRGALTDV